jgi:hypothetical protein
LPRLPRLARHRPSSALRWAWLGVDPSGQMQLLIQKHWTILLLLHTLQLSSSSKMVLHCTVARRMASPVMCDCLRCEREREDPARRPCPMRARRRTRSHAQRGPLSVLSLTSFLDTTSRARHTHKSARLMTRHGSGAHVTRSRAPSPYTSSSV